MDNDVKEYIDRQRPLKVEIINKLRGFLLKTLPGITEKMKYGVIGYENLYYIVALKGQVNMGFSVLGLSDEEAKLFSGTGKTMKHLEFKSAGDVDEKKLAELILLVRKKSKPVEK
ncbi:Uncharacterised protein [Candidatus Tiddalikarchaeum anstoanum]|nr:Uncharacterised protein [Candidatus Tiddalikarchaeum anstoanum]